MAVPFSNTKLRVPKGFQNILEGLAREILRNQPENMFEFGSKYFDQLLRVREETGHDPAVHGARLEDRFYNNDSFKSPSVDPSSPQQQDAALTIQTNYRKHAAEQEVGEMREDEAAQKIQAGFRGYQDRAKYEEIKGDGKKEEEEEVDIDLNDPDVEKAAVKIQAGFKGFKARQEIKETKEKSEISQSENTEATKDEEAGEEEVDIDLNDPEVGAAALKIQAGFRGFQSRKEITKQQEQQKSGNESEDQPKVESKEEEEVDIDLNDPDVANAAVKIQSGFRGHQARKELKTKQEQQNSGNEPEDQPKVESKEEEEVDIDLNDPDVANAAVKIQSGFRGHQARKELKTKQDQQKTEEKPEEQKQPEGETKKEEEEEVDIDLNDPDVANAAVKIQSGFRGHQARKELKTKQETKEEEAPKKQEEEEVDIDLEDPEVANAALKIQAGFKGMKARQEIKEMKDGNTPEPKAEIKEEKTEEKQEEKTEEKAEEIDIDLNDPETEKAALKIQAGFKGFQTRKEIKSKKEGEKTEEAPKEPEKAEEKKEEEVDIDLNDPEVEKAATKIQAGFKGFKTRKELKDKVEGDQSGDKEEESGDKQDSGEGTSEEPKQEAEKPKEEAEQAKAEEEPKTEGEEIDIDLNDPEVAKAATKIQAGFKGFKTRQDLNKNKADDESKE